MTRINLWMIGVVCFPVTVAVAQDAPTTPPPAPAYTEETTYSDRQQMKYDTSGDLFHATEVSIDAFGGYSLDQTTIRHLSTHRIHDDGRANAGAGITYYFTKCLGLGVDAWSENAGHSFIDNLSGSLVLRFPFDTAHVAPYVFGGGGYQFDPGRVGFGHVGVGVEYRFVSHVGVFTDARYVMTDRTPNFAMFRAGLRFSF